MSDVGFSAAGLQGAFFGVGRWGDGGGDGGRGGWGGEEEENSCGGEERGGVDLGFDFEKGVEGGV